jgi:hypothetical protein
MNYSHYDKYTGEISLSRMHPFVLQLLVLLICHFIRKQHIIDVSFCFDIKIKQKSKKYWVPHLLDFFCRYVEICGAQKCLVTCMA